MIVEQVLFVIEDFLNELDVWDEEVVLDSEEFFEGGECGDMLFQKRFEKLFVGFVCRVEFEVGEQIGDDRDSGGFVFQFDYEVVVNRLFEMVSCQSIFFQNRKCFYKVIWKLQDLVGGIFFEDEILEKVCRCLFEGRWQKKMKKQKCLFRLQCERGKGEQEFLSLGMERKRSRRRGVGDDFKVWVEVGEQLGIVKWVLF